MELTELLRPTTRADLAAIRAAETDGETRRWLGDISTDWHLAAMSTPGVEHLSILSAGCSAGFVVLAGIGGSSVELRRIVTFPAFRGRGLGRQALDAAVGRAFHQHGASGVWLDVKKGNIHARTVYERSGFVVDREVSDAMVEPDGSLTTLVIMSRPRDDRQATQRGTPT